MRRYVIEYLKKKMEENKEKSTNGEIFREIERENPKDKPNEYKHWYLIMNGKRSNKVVDLRRLQTCALSYIFIATHEP